MFSFGEGIAEDLKFRLMPAAESPEFELSDIALMERQLPARDVTSENFTGTYVAFILFCNPQFPSTVDTTQLEEKFNSVPKTDNKEFQTWRLFELIKQLDAKEIDTWGQLALELGVEPPDTSKQQSIQKVQQYTVRLKRWMRAMHIDAFFEWLMGKQHSYVTNIPPSEDPYPAAGRDGVPTEEDLAIRALEPAFRPKRGRRRNSENEADDEERRTRLDTTAPFERAPMSAYPSSAHPGVRAPWGGVSALTPQGYDWQGSHSALNTSAHMRWGHDPQGDMLPSPHPMSAMPGSSSHPFEDHYAGEPMSAITPSTKKRRKHGPAVSSAWPSSTPTGSKPRGRPPAARNVQNGPFGTFPVQPSVEEQAHSFSVTGNEPVGTAMPPPMPRMPSAGAGRPGRLSLTVPQHTGAPVRLATPPRLVVNDDTSRATSEIENLEMPVLSFETMKRTLASDLLRADMMGRPQRLNGDEAKRLADAVLERIGLTKSDETSHRAHLARFTAASWLGLGDQLNIPVGPASGTQKKLRITRYRTDAEGYEEVVPANEEASEGVRQIFDLRWQATQGSCQGNFELTGMILAPANKSGKSVDNIHDLIVEKVISEAKNVGLSAETEYIANRAPRSYEKYGSQIRNDAGVVGSDDDIDWKTKSRMLEFGASLAHGEFDRYRAQMLQKVLDIFL